MTRKRPETPLDIDRFITEIRSYKERTGKSHKAIAEDLGIELGYFHKILYKDKPLTLNIVEKAAPVLGLTIHDFLPNPPAVDGGPPRDEDFGNIMGILGKDLTPETRAAMIEMAKAAQVKGRARLEAEKKARKP
jgi:transcriptional regulator with XRE-family HTH domain